ncbi:MAG: ATP-binding protein [Terracidiphilus sp.]|jgi:PAS domain S-box-containing protein
MGSDGRYRQFDEAGQDGILILDPQTGAILDMNSILARMLDYSPVELLGMTLWEIGLPEDVVASKSVFQKLIENNSVHYDNLPFVAKGGDLVRVEVTGKVYERRGEKLVQCNICSIGEPELAVLPESQIRRTQEMEAVGQIAGGLAHDLNNLLGVILKCCELLDKQPALPEESRELVQEARTAGTSAQALTQRLLAFSRGQLVQHVPVDLNETVNRMEGMLRRMAGDGIELVTLPGRGLGNIHANASQLEQILMNLAANARDAMPRGGKIIVETDNVVIDEANAGQYPSIRPGRYVMLSVSDTGTGMDPEIQSRIFEPFFTTKPFGRGTGLGLSTVYSIVEQSGGAISVYSQPGAGATFKIFFPRFEQALEVVRPPRPEKSHGETETILLVDDAGSLRGLIRRLLEDAGFTVLDSGDPALALRIAEEHPGPIALLITDVILPGFSGSELAARVTVGRPQTKVLYVSGFDGESIIPALVPGHSFGFLKKPFTQDDLLRKIRQILDSSIEPPLRSVP